MRKIDLKNFQVATSETAREINRRIILNFLRTHQPISRADLARRSGLQFSTVSLIVEELITQQWITEGAVTNAPRGRKPRVLHFNNDRRRIIGIDIRPSNTLIGMADMDGRFVHQEKLRTNPDSTIFIKELCAAVSEFIKQHSFNYAGIGVCVPGRVAIAEQRLAFAPNIGWRDLDIKTPLQHATGLEVLIESAPNACALAEIWFGRHSENVRDLVAIAVSEGVGAGVFSSGQLLLGPEGMAGEFGHVTIDENGPRCNCGNKGCWEVFASNSAAVRYFVENRNGANPTGTDPSPTFEDVLRNAEQKDPAAIAALEKMGRYLGAGLSMIVTGLAPSVIVIVGEVVNAWSIVSPQIQKVVAERTQPHLHTKIVPTDDITQPRLRGAVAIVLHNHLGAPIH